MSIAHNIEEKARTGDVLISETVDFPGLLLSKPVLKGLADGGFLRPSPIQLKAIPLGRCGLDLIVQAKSGTGKTCVFTVVALESVDVTSACLQVLVLAPTREIAQQIQDVIRVIGSHMPGLKCHTFIGGMPVLQDKILCKNCHIAVGTPGRVKQLLEIGALKAGSVRLFVLDEADKLLEESFQDSINWIYSALPENKQIVALSATYPEYLAQHLTDYMRNPTFVRLNAADPALLGIKQYHVVVPHHPMPNIVFNAKTEMVVKIISSVTFQQCLIFSNLQTRAQDLQSELQLRNWPTACIAGCLQQKERNFAMDQLKTYKCRILISTDLTSRGIDADKVNLVINLDVPPDHETYLHRIGRAGRFGSFGAAVTIISQGSQEKELWRIEKLCKTYIHILPDPPPKDLVTKSVPVKLDDVVSTEQLITSPECETTQACVVDSDQDKLQAESSETGPPAQYSPPPSTAQTEPVAFSQSAAPSAADTQASRTQTVSQESPFSADNAAVSANCTVVANQTHTEKDTNNLDVDQHVPAFPKFTDKFHDHNQIMVPLSLSPETSNVILDETCLHMGDTDGVKESDKCASKEETPTLVNTHASKQLVEADTESRQQTEGVRDESSLQSEKDERQLSPLLNHSADEASLQFNSNENKQIVDCWDEPCLQGDNSSNILFQLEKDERQFSRQLEPSADEFSMQIGSSQNMFSSQEISDPNGKNFQESYTKHEATESANTDCGGGDDFQPVDVMTKEAITPAENDEMQSAQQTENKWNEFFEIERDFQVQQEMKSSRAETEQCQDSQEIGLKQQVSSDIGHSQSSDNNAESSRLEYDSANHSSNLLLCDGPDQLQVEKVCKEESSLTDGDVGKISDGWKDFANSLAESVIVEAKKCCADIIKQDDTVNSINLATQKNEKEDINDMVEGAYSQNANVVADEGSELSSTFGSGKQISEFCNDEDASRVMLRDKVDCARDSEENHGAEPKDYAHVGDDHQLKLGFCHDPSGKADLGNGCKESAIHGVNSVAAANPRTEKCNDSHLNKVQADNITQLCEGKKTEEGSVTKKYICESKTLNQAESPSFENLAPTRNEPKSVDATKAESSQPARKIVQSTKRRGNKNFALASFLEDVNDGNKTLNSLTIARGEKKDQSTVSSEPQEMENCSLKFERSKERRSSLDDSNEKEAAAVTCPLIPTNTDNGQLKTNSVNSNTAAQSLESDEKEPSSGELTLDNANALLSLVTCVDHCKFQASFSDLEKNFETFCKDPRPSEKMEPDGNLNTLLAERILDDSPHLQAYCKKQKEKLELSKVLFERKRKAAEEKRKSLEDRKYNSEEQGDPTMTSESRDPYSMQASMASEASSSFEEALYDHVMAQEAKLKRGSTAKNQGNRTSLQNFSANKHRTEKDSVKTVDDCSQQRVSTEKPVEKNGRHREVNILNNECRQLDEMHDEMLRRRKQRKALRAKENADTSEKVSETPLSIKQEGPTSQSGIELQSEDTNSQISLMNVVEKTKDSSKSLPENQCCNTLDNSATRVLQNRSEDHKGQQVQNPQAKHITDVTLSQKPNVSNEMPLFSKKVRDKSNTFESFNTEEINLHGSVKQRVSVTSGQHTLQSKTPVTEESYGAEKELQKSSRKSLMSKFNSAAAEQVSQGGWKSSESDTVIPGQKGGNQARNVTKGESKVIHSEFFDNEENGVQKSTKHRENAGNREEGILRPGRIVQRTKKIGIESIKKYHEKGVAPRKPSKTEARLAGLEVSDGLTSPATSLSSRSAALELKNPGTGTSSSEEEDSSSEDGASGSLHAEDTPYGYLNENFVYDQNQLPHASTNHFSPQLFYSPWFPPPQYHWPSSEHRAKSSKKNGRYEPNLFPPYAPQVQGGISPWYLQHQYYQNYYSSHLPASAAHYSNWYSPCYLPQPQVLNSYATEALNPFLHASMQRKYIREMTKWSLKLSKKYKVTKGS